MFGALPTHLPFFQYDEDGDAIMTDGPLTPPRAQRFAVAPPPAPARPAAPFVHTDDDSVVRNLAEAMAEAVLRDEEPPILAAPPAAAPPAGEPVAAAAAAEEDWCISVTCADLALSLDMRHPRVILNFLRFINSYNELAPQGEQIHLPQIPRSTADMILSHVGVADPVPEFAAEVAELRSLVNTYSACHCCSWSSESDSERNDTDDYYRD